MNLLTWDILWSPNQKIHTKPAFSALFTSLPSITIAGHHLDILAPFLRLAKTIFPIRLSWNTPDFCLSCHITCTNLQRKKNLVFLQSFSKVNKRVESMKSIQFNIIKNQHSPTGHVEQIIISPPPPPTLLCRMSDLSVAEIVQYQVLTHLQNYLRELYAYWCVNIT